MPSTTIDGIKKLILERPDCSYFQASLARSTVISGLIPEPKCQKSDGPIIVKYSKCTLIRPRDRTTRAGRVLFWVFSPILFAWGLAGNLGGFAHDLVFGLLWLVFCCGGRCGMPCGPSRQLPSGQRSAERLVFRGSRTILLSGVVESSQAFFARLLLQRRRLLQRSLTLSFPNHCSTIHEIKGSKKEE